MKKKLLLFAYTLSSCTHLSLKRLPNSEQLEKPRHLIVTIHGVRGTEKSFGSFHEIIQKQLEEIRPKEQALILNFTYKTGADNYNPIIIKKSLNDAILNKLGGSILDSDRISVVSYSMGSQVMAAWYFNTVFDSSPQYSRIAEKTKTMVSLGGVFWGSLNANLGSSLIPKIGFETDDLVKKIQMSGNEIRELSALSNSSVDLRAKMMVWAQTATLRQKFSPKIYSVAGLIPCLNQKRESNNQVGCAQFQNSFIEKLNSKLILNSLFAGLYRWETDMMVTVPSTATI